MTVCYDWNMRVYIYRSIVLILAILAVSKVIYFRALLNQQAFLDIAKRFYDTETLLSLYDSYTNLRAATLIVFFFLSIAFYILSNRFFRNSLYWLSCISIVVAPLVTGVLFSIFNQQLSDYYAILFTGRQIDTSVFSLFIQSFFRNSIVGFYFFSLSAFLSLIEHLFIKSTKYSNRLKVFSFAHWLIGGVVFFFLLEFLAYSLSHQFNFETVSISLFPTICLSYFLTVLIMLWLSFLSSAKQNTFKEIRHEMPKFFILTVGLFGVIVLSQAQALDFSWTLYIVLFSSILPTFLLIIFATLSVTYLLYKANIGNIKRRLTTLRKLEKVSSELSLLKSQINPHFLFNSLNTVYGLALEEQSPKSAEGIQKLSDMMRFMLQENTAERIPLEREIKYINDYVDFQRLRIADKENIQLDINISDGCKGEVAPMLLIPMIENAFKHGVSLEKPSWINIKLECNQNEVHLNIQNSMHQKAGRNLEESGIGLENVRQRLTILYPDQHLFQLFEDAEKFEANIKITLA